MRAITGCNVSYLVILFGKFHNNFVAAMRVNLRKLFLIGFFVAILWLIVSYMSTLESPKPVTKFNKVIILENTLNLLEERVDMQLKESNKLLDRVKQHLKKTEDLAKERDAKEQMNADTYNPVLPVLVIACDRVSVHRCLENLVRFRPSKKTFPIIVSQDCGHNATYHVIKRFVDEDSSITVVRQPDLTDIKLPRTKLKFNGYYKIARHFRFALNHVFKTLNHEAVIIVEDDLDISPDFFEYFLGTYPLLLKDPSIWCISAWNDNGKKDIIDLNRPELLHRTDFFPGLGWLLRQESWEYLEPNWPPAFFDDWLRNPQNTRGRSCIRPEISRTYTFGKVGVSKGLFFDMHLRHMQLNTEYVEFTKMNLTYLIKHVYDPAFKQAAFSAPLKTAVEVVSYAGVADEKARVTYKDAKSFQKAAKTLGLMDDFRSGIPRTAYLGIVNCYIRGRRVYLVPEFDWVKYDPAWG